MRRALCSFILLVLLLGWSSSLHADLQPLWREGGFPMWASGAVIQPSLYEDRDAVLVVLPEFPSGGTLTFWEVSSGRLLAERTVPDYRAISPDGRRALRYHLQTAQGEVLTIPDLQRRSGFSLPALLEPTAYFAGDSRHVLFFYTDTNRTNWVAVLDGETGAPLSVRRPPMGIPTGSAIVSPHHDDIVLFVSSWRALAYDWRRNDLFLVGSIQNPSTGDFSPDGQFVALAGLGGIERVRFADGATVWRFSSEHGVREVRAVRHSPDGMHLISVEEWSDQERYLVNRRVADGAVQWATPIGSLRAGYLGSGSAVGFPAHGRSVVLRTIAGLWEFDLATGQLLRGWSGHCTSVRTLAFSPDGQRLLSGSQAGWGNLAQLLLHDVATGDRMARIFLQENTPVWLGWDPHTASILSLEVGGSGGLRWRDPTGGAIVSELSTSQPAVVQPSDPDYLVYLSYNTANTRTELRERDLRTGHERLLYPDDLFGVRALATVRVGGSPNRRLTAFADEDRTLLTLIEDGTVRWQRELGGIDWLCFSPDGTYLAMALRHEQVIRVFRSDGTPALNLYFGQGSWQGAFSHDGQYLFTIRDTGARNSQLLVWRLSDGALVDQRSAPFLTALAVSPVDYLVALSEGSLGTTVTLYQWMPPQPRTLRVHLSLSDLLGEPPTVAEVRLRPADSSESLELLVGVNPDGGFALVPPADTDRVSLSVKTGSWLRRTVEVDLSHQTEVHLSLPNGDIDGDNEVTLADFALLVQHLEDGPSAYPTDLNRDGKTDLLDFAILMRHWGMVGDE